MGLSSTTRFTLLPTHNTIHQHNQSKHALLYMYSTSLLASFSLRVWFSFWSSWFIAASASFLPSPSASTVHMYVHVHVTVRWEVEKVAHGRVVGDRRRKRERERCRRRDYYMYPQSLRCIYLTEQNFGRWESLANSLPNCLWRNQFWQIIKSIFNWHVAL